MPDLEVSITTENRLGHPGSETTYTFVVTNVGPTPSAGAMVTFHCTRNRGRPPSVSARQAAEVQRKSSATSVQSIPVRA